MSNAEAENFGPGREQTPSHSNVLSSLEVMHGGQVPDSSAEADRRLIDYVNAAWNKGHVAVGSQVTLTEPEVA